MIWLRRENTEGYVIYLKNLESII